MVKEIKITKRANQKLLKTAKYLEEEFGFSVAQNFSVRVIDFLEILAQYPQIGTCVDNKKKVYGFVLSKQTTLFYRLTTNKIIILNLFDNRTNPTKGKH